MEDQDSIIGSVLHPTDFSEGSKVAFHHALKVALLAKSELTLIKRYTGWDVGVVRVSRCA